MTSEKLAAMIAREKKILETNMAKKAELDEKIRKSEAKLQEYEIMQNSQKYNDLASLARDKGFSLEDVLVALQSGDLLALQERMEAVHKAEEAAAQGAGKDGISTPVDVE